MAPEPVTRKLAAILACDVVGYSRLMGKDESGTHARLRAMISEVIVRRSPRTAGGSSRPPATES
jgi:class 3 adenylate cyclase